jgi:hypothetical protein
VNSLKSETEVTAMMKAFSVINWGEERTEQISDAIGTAAHYVYTLAQAPLDPRDEEPFVFETGAHLKGAGV